MADPGPLQGIVTTALQIGAAGASLYTLVLGKAPLPTTQPVGATRGLGVVAGVCVALVETASRSQPEAKPFTVAAVVALAALVAMLAVLIRLKAKWCFTCPGDETIHVAGDALRAEAAAVLGGRRDLPPPYGPLNATPASAREYFCDSGKDPEFIWRPGSQGAVLGRIFLAYCAVLVCGVVAASSAGVALGKPDLVVEKRDDQARIELPADILFGFDEATLSGNAGPYLLAAATRIRRSGATRVAIEGHTDAKGSDMHNKRLSERRAAAVYENLVGAQGLTGIKFTVAGYGSARATAPNVKADGSDNPEGRRLNRRVEIVLPAS